jgi:hypothetical protein
MARRKPSYGDRVQPSASGTRGLDAAPAGGAAGRTRDGGGHQSGTRAAHTQKNARKLWLQEPWGIPPEAHAAFVCAMAEMLGERLDYAYARPGIGQLCMLWEPLACQREVRVTERRTAVA